MKRLLYICFILVLSCLFLTGCFTTSGSKKGTTKKKRAPKGDVGLYSQVPAAMRSDVKEAEFDLKQAKENVTLAEKKVTLAEMKKERALLGKKHADTNKKLAEILEKKANITIEVKKFEAIDKAKLGDKVDNIKNIANQKSKELEVESDSVIIQAELATYEIKMKQLTKKIREQERKLGESDSKSAKKKKKRK